MVLVAIAIKLNLQMFRFMSLEKERIEVPFHT